MNFSVIAQSLGILGMVMNVASLQAKKQRTIIIMQFFGSLFFSFNMLMLNAYTGAVLNILGIIRALVYANKERIKHIKRVNVIFILFYIASYFAAFSVFHKPVTVLNVIIELLPVVAVIATTVSFSSATAADTRKYVFISSPSWFIYNCVNFSIGGIICELLNMISVVIAILRLDRKQKK